MIGLIHGVLLEKQPPQLMVDVNGVGYELLAPMSTFYRLPSVGEVVRLHTHLQVREDAHVLFGFHDRQERALFRQLTRVNGVGPKLALAVLSGIEADAFVQCVREHNVNALIRVPGIGRKTAERMLIELQDRLDEWHAPAPVLEAGRPAPVASGSSALRDAEAALVALGYKPQEALRVVNAVYVDEQQSSEELIRLALKSLVKL